MPRRRQYRTSRLAHKVTIGSNTARLNAADPTRRPLILRQRAPLRDWIANVEFKVRMGNMRHVEFLIKTSTFVTDPATGKQIRSYKRTQPPGLSTSKYRPH
jgi:hypothetical protein